MNVLVIVDMQKEYSYCFNVKYLEELDAFLKLHKDKYDKIVFVYQSPDLLEEDGHSTTETIAKSANIIIEKWFYDIDDDWLMMTKNEGNSFSENTKGVLEDKHGNVILPVKHFDGIGDKVEEELS